MRRFIPYIAFGFLLLAAWSCTRNDEPDTLSTNQGKIIIKTALDSQVVTRAADNNDSQVELKITRIDLFVVDPTGDYLIDHREHYEAAEGESLNDVTLEDGEGTLTLSGKDRNAFSPNKEYHIYLVANAPEAVAAKLESTTEVTKLSDLTSLMYEEVTSETTYLHLSGTGEVNAPETFLMDAVGTVSKDDTSRGIVLYDGNSTNNTNIYAEFKRAAAKVVVNIKQGAAVEFMREILLTTEEHGVSASGKSQYVFYNLPVKTAVLAEGGDNITFDNNHLIETNLVTIPSESGKNRPTFSWADGVGSVGVDGKDEVKIQIIGYAYAHNWYQQSTINFEPSLLLNLPMWWDADNNPETSGTNKDGKEAPRPGNWYKIPLSQEKKFERNTCYIVNLTINAVGAESKSEAIELDDIDYDTRPWDDITINVGDNSTRPTYLKLNTDVVKMYNTNIDTDQLIFSSSSPITSIVLTDVYKQNTDGSFTKATDNYDAYYIDKYGDKQTLENSIRNTISASVKDGALTGNITITSPIRPTNEAEIQEAILAELGPAEAAPDMAQPVYDGEVPSRPETVVEPTAPNPSDYISEVRQNGNWSSSWGQTSRTRDVTVTQYQYIESDGTITFQSRTGTTTDSQTRENWWNSWNDNNIQYGTPTSWSNWADDTAKNREWSEALVAYESRVKEYEDYLKALKKYEQDVLALQNNEEYQKYVTDMAAYNAAWEAYRARKAEYDAAAQVIRNRYSGGQETHYNTVRYLEFVVTNGDELTATFRVEQYPVIYITHVMGHYSYRSDFNGTTWLQEGSPSNINNCSWSSRNNSWSYTHLTENKNAGQFRSKVYNPDGEGNSSQDSYPIDYYYWSSGSHIVYNAGSLDNPRMYHVNVTATSGTYTIGRPQLDSNGYTDSGKDNAKLVSPSFMIASQLGATQEFDSAQIASQHCNQYVEVAQDGTVYDDWRLPTAAEINIIIDLQYNSRAMDPVLTGRTYWSASGAQNTGTGDGTNRTRCIRDAY